MGKSCWRAIAVQCNRHQTWQFYLFFPALVISGTHKVPGIKIYKGGTVGHVTLSCIGPFDRQDLGGHTRRFYCILLVVFCSPPKLYSTSQVPLQML